LLFKPFWICHQIDTLYISSAVRKGYKSPLLHYYKTLLQA